MIRAVTSLSGVTLGARNSDPDSDLGDCTMTKTEQQDEAQRAARAAVAAPPAPPGELPDGEVRKTRAVAEALVRLGENADSMRIAEAVRKQAGLDIDPAEVATIRAALRERAQTPPPPDQPP